MTPKLQLFHHGVYRGSLQNMESGLNCFVIDMCICHAITV